MKLAVDNNFQPQAQQAYLVGHEFAIEKASGAGREQIEEQRKFVLTEAFSIEAFACHFLTDSLSAGHIKLGLGLYNGCDQK